MSDDLLAAVGEMLELSPNARKLRRQPRLDLDRDALREAVEIVTPARRMVAAFEAWAARHELQSASFAVLRRGRLAARAGYGGESPNAANEFASCSKLITGLAIAQLVRAGQLRYDTTMQQIFGEYLRIGWKRLNDIALLTDPRPVDIASRFEVVEQPSQMKATPFEFASARQKLPTIRRSAARRGPLVPILMRFPAWFRSLTVTEVLTHTSGIRGNIGEGNPYEISTEDRFELIVTAMTPGPKVWSYENNNYVVLGIIVERLTGKSFEQAARELVFAPLGIGSFSADNRGPYAGCWLSAADYARMLRYLDGDLSPLGAHGPDTWPRVGSYSIGTYSWNTGDSFETSHAGGWTWNDGTRSASLEAFQQYWQDVRTGYFVRYSPSSSRAFSDLSTELRAIAHDPTNWWPPFLDLVERMYKLTR